MTKQKWLKTSAGITIWTLTANPHLLASDSIKTMAAKYNLTSAQVLFCYVSQKGII
jgi:diketogulonate reductase-like aldo/keto reductase